MDTRREMQRHLVTAVGDAAPRGPPARREHVEDPEVFDDAVPEGRIELQKVAVGAHAAIADEVPRVLEREQVLACRHWARITLAQIALELVVQRVASLLIPPESVARDR